MSMRYNSIIYAFKGNGYRPSRPAIQPPTAEAELRFPSAGAWDYRVTLTHGSHTIISACLRERRAWIRDRELLELQRHEHALPWHGKFDASPFQSQPAPNGLSMRPVDLEGEAEATSNQRQISQPLPLS